MGMLLPRVSKIVYFRVKNENFTWWDFEKQENETNKINEEKNLATAITETKNKNYLKTTYPDSGI